MILDARGQTLVLGGKKLPGIMTSIRVRGELVYKAESKEGVTGRSYEITGWGDAEVEISLVIPDDEASTAEGATPSRYTRSAAIVAAFKSVDTKGIPVIYALTHRLADAWKIKRLLFVECETSESADEDVIATNIKFVEYNPVVAKKQEQKKEAQTASVAPAARMQTSEQASRAMAAAATATCSPAEAARIKTAKASVGKGLKAKVGA